MKRFMSRVCTHETEYKNLKNKEDYAGNVNNTLMPSWTEFTFDNNTFYQIFDACLLYDSVNQKQITVNYKAGLEFVSNKH